MDLTFELIADEPFDDMTERFNKLMHTYFMRLTNYKGYKIEKLSFINYHDRIVYDTFPFGKKLLVNNFSSFDTFGFGSYAGYFFDFIVRFHDGKPMNQRLFYDVEGEEAPVSTITQQLPTEQTHDPSTHMFILGEYRRYHKKGRTTYVEYSDKEITLTEARKLERSL